MRTHHLPTVFFSEMNRHTTLSSPARFLYLCFCHSFTLQTTVIQLRKKHWFSRDGVPVHAHTQSWTKITFICLWCSLQTYSLVSSMNGQQVLTSMDQYGECLTTVVICILQNTELFHSSASPVTYFQPFRRKSHESTAGKSMCSLENMSPQSIRTY